jgi:hypothetical protein
MSFWDNLGSGLNSIGNIATGGALGAAESGVSNVDSSYSAAKSAVTDTASAAEAVATTTLSAAEWMATPRNWLRVVFVVGGGVVILMGIYVALKDTGAGGAAKSVGLASVSDGASEALAAPKAAPSPPPAPTPSPASAPKPAPTPTPAPKVAPTPAPKAAPKPAPKGDFYAGIAKTLGTT